MDRSNVTWVMMVLDKYVPGNTGQFLSFNGRPNRIMASSRKSSSIASYLPLSVGGCDDGRDFISTETCDSTFEKHQPIWSEVDAELLNRYSISSGEKLKWLRRNLKLQLLGILLCVAGLVLILNFPACESPLETTVSVLSDCGNDAQAAAAGASKASAKSSSSGVLEVFQVYQPVLTPLGPTDQTISSDGSSNTTTIVSAEGISNCTQVLMEYSFGFSYGHPFVGMFFHIRSILYQMLTFPNR
jgi:hypothetical protein